MRSKVFEGREEGGQRETFFGTFPPPPPRFQLLTPLDEKGRVV